MKIIPWVKFKPAHSALRGFQIKLKKPSMKPSQNQFACCGGSEYDLFEILDLRIQNPPARQLSMGRIGKPPRWCWNLCP